MKKKATPYLMAFCLPLLFILFSLVLLHIYPFGSKTLVGSDMSNQYVAIMNYFKSNLFNIGNLKYTFSVGLGVNFFPILTYYLMSPINLLALFFPSEYIPVFFEVNILLDISLISLTTYFFFDNSIFLNRHRNNNSKIWAIILSCSFALSNYFIIYDINVMWFNVIILFPFVLYFFEKIIYDKKDGTRSHLYYYVLLSLSLIMNYYIALMFLIFLMLIGIWWIGDKIINSSFEKRNLQTCILLIVETLLSIGTASIITIPSYMAQRNVNQIPFTLSIKRIYSLKELMISVFDGGMRVNAPLIATNILCVLILLYYFLDKKFNLREKVLLFSFLIFLVLSSCLTTPYMMWHAFSMPNGFPQRESFVIVFVLCAIVYFALVSQEKMDWLILLLSSGIVLTILVISSLVFKLISVKYFILNVFLVILTFGALLLFYQQHKSYKYLSLVLLLISPLVLEFNSMSSLSTGLMKFDDYRKVEKPTKQVVQAIKSKDKSFYRIGSNYQINMNDPLLYNYAGVSGYVSQQPTTMTDYLSGLGYYQKHQWFRWSQYNNGSTRAIDSLLGIKYVLNTKENMIKNTQDIQSFPTYNSPSNLYSEQFMKSHGIIVRKNNDAFPMTFKLQKNTIRSLNYNPAQDIFTQLNLIFGDIAGNYSMYEKNAVNKINIYNYTVTARQSGEMYLYIPSNLQTLLGDISVYVNGKKINSIFGKNLNGENGICSLGNFKEGTSVRLRFKGRPKITNFFVYSENQKSLNKISRAAQNNHTNIETKSNSHIIINTDKYFKKQNLGIAIPYDPAWHIQIDGKKAFAEPCLGYLTNIKITSGRHKIEMKYESPWLRRSAVLSILCVLLFIALYRFYRLKSKNIEG